MQLRPNELLWNAESEKWADRVNDFFVRQNYLGKWVASARYGFNFFDVSRKEYAQGFLSFDFDTEHEALVFMTQYLTRRYERMADPRWTARYI